MIPSEIKKIAEEYAELNPPSTDDDKLRQDGIYLNATMVFEPFLRFLSERYCIVERKKVMDEYKEACDEIDFETETKSALHQNVALGRKDLLESLFGPDLRKEEEDA